MTTKTEPQPLQIEYGGETYEFDELDLDVDEAETIQKYVGRSIGDFANGLATCEIKSVRALWWLLRKRSGAPARSIASSPGQDFKPLQLWRALMKAQAAENDRLAAAQAAAEEAEQEGSPDPTLPAPSSPAPAGTTTTPAAAAALLSPPG